MEGFLISSALLFFFLPPAHSELPIVQIIKFVSTSISGFLHLLPLFLFDLKDECELSSLELTTPVAVFPSECCPDFTSE